MHRSRNTFPLETLECDTKNLRDLLLPKLIGQVFHVTSGTAFWRIHNCGGISPNADGRYQATSPQSENSFGRTEGAVCLVDLRDATTDVIDDALDRFYFLDPFHTTRVNVFLVLGSSANAKLIPNTVGRANPAFKVAVPNVEVWYPGRLPLSEVSHALRVSLKRLNAWDFMDPDALADLRSRKNNRHA
jgi:hypothetical protein